MTIEIKAHANALQIAGLKESNQKASTFSLHALTCIYTFHRKFEDMAETWSAD